MADTFLKTLKFLEQSSLTSKGETKKLLRRLVEFVEQGSFTDSQAEKFILANFRCSTIELTKKWNSIFFDKKKSSHTFRSQLSSLNTYLVSLFGVSGTQLNDAFITEDKVVLKHIKDILDAFEVGDFNIAERFPFITLGYFKCEETSSVYAVEECEKEIQLLKSLDIKVIDDMVRQVDLDKLLFVIQSIREPLVTNVYEKRQGKSCKVKTASVNQRKLEFNKKFHLVKPKKLKPVIDIEVENAQVLVANENSVGVAPESATVQQEEVTNITSGVGSEPAETNADNPYGLHIRMDLVQLIEKRLKAKRKVTEFNDDDTSKIITYKKYLQSLTMETSWEELYQWLRNVNAIYLSMALDELRKER